MEPELVDGCGALVFELIGPFAAVFVLGIFPFGANALLEEVVVGFEGELGDGSDVVLEIRSEQSVKAKVRQLWNQGFLRRRPRTPQRSRR